MAVSTISHVISANLMIGRENLRGIAGVDVVEEPEWDSDSKKWVLLLRITPRNIPIQDIVPLATDWYVKIAPEYPFGRLEFFPSKSNGLAFTFPHQSLNIEHPDNAWRQGKLCLGDQFATFEDTFLSSEPFDADLRLPWHVERAKLWLERAARNDLFKLGDFFELPDFAPGRYSHTAFVETDRSFKDWESASIDHGLFKYFGVSPLEKSYIVKEFLNVSGRRQIVPRTAFGTYIRKLGTAKHTGAWIRVGSMPIVTPWQAPATWGNLRQCLREQGLDLDRFIDSLFSSRSENEKIGTLFVFGFPIPERLGDEESRYHWQAAQLPGLFFSDSPVRGFRTCTRSARRANRERLATKKRISWQTSDNWSIDQIRTRVGTGLNELLSKNTVLLGAGAIGSAIGEMLVRNGVDNLTICDGDDLEAGNLVRHTLDLADVSKNKATALAKKLARISPFAKVDAMDKDLKSDRLALLSEFELIIDCTASQAMLSILTMNEFSNDVRFNSLSISYGAKRLYFYSAVGRRFPFDNFRDRIVPWFELDYEQNRDIQTPREGIGCWHPVFPARSDDIWLLAATGFKLIVESLSVQEEQFRVFEQIGGPTFGGLKEISLADDE